MLRNWQAEKQSLVTNNHVLKLSKLRKRLKEIWRQAGRPDEEISSVDRMKKAEVSKHLYLCFHIMAMSEKHVVVEK